MNVLRIEALARTEPIPAARALVRRLHVALPPAQPSGYTRPSKSANVISPDEYLYHPDGRYEWSPERYAAALNAAERDLRWALGQPWCRGAVLVVGIQGSGKSTYVERERRADRVYVDDTFTDPALRRRFIDIARAAGKRIEAHWLAEPLEVCLERNAGRPQHRRVREDVIRDEYARLLATVPSRDEGFHAVIVRSVAL